MSVSLADSCPCGSELAVKCESPSEAAKRHESWLEKHQPCRAAWVALPNASEDEARRILHFPQQS